MDTTEISNRTIRLIDDLKAVCHQFGMGNDGNEYKVITQVFLYKFVNDKFGYELLHSEAKEAKKIKGAEKWEIAYKSLSEAERKAILRRMSANVPVLRPEHLVANLWNQQKLGNFDDIFDSTMVDIADLNIDIFSTQTTTNEKLPIFERLTRYVEDPSSRPNFARALVDKLVNFSFMEVFELRYDFFSRIFEYLIKDYNTSSGDTYAEYYTPHAMATIMARILVGDNADLHNIECDDPSAGTGTLLMALAHQVGEDRCTIFSQDISQKSNKLLKLNLLLNGLVSSLPNAIQGDTLVAPYHMSDDRKRLRKFDFVVSNPPFKLDFSDAREKIAAQVARFWAGVPNVPKKDKKGMEIYLCFLQHVLNSMKEKTGRAAIVVPTGFLKAKDSISTRIRERIVDEHILMGAISMPPNVFANTGTNVSILFFDNSRKTEKVVLIDATKLGEEYKEGKLQKRRLRNEEVEEIIKAFRGKKTIERFAAAVRFDQIIKKNYVLTPGVYFEARVNHVDITPKGFREQMSRISENLKSIDAEYLSLRKSIANTLNTLQF